MKQVWDNLQKILSRGECVQLLALPGMGGSRLLKSLDGFILNLDLYQNAPYQTLIDAIRQENQTSLICLDPINSLLKPDYLPFFSYLKGHRDQYKYQLKYIFLYQNATPLSPKSAEFFGPLSPLASENIVYFPALDDHEIPDLITSQYSPNINFIPSKSQLQEIIKLSGGIQILIKIILQHQRDQKEVSLDHPGLHIALQRIQSLIGLDTPVGILKKHGLVNDHGQYRSSLLQSFLDKYTSNQLSASENLLLDFLKLNINDQVTKDQICHVIYPDAKNLQGISDSAIDQLMYRLRTKVKNDYKITTFRGRGYKLSPI